MDFLNSSSSSSKGSSPLFPTVVFVVFAPFQQQCFLPAYELAVSEANAQYSQNLHFELASVTRPHITSCVTLTGNVVDLAGLFYYRSLHPRKNLIIVSPSCVTTIYEVAPLINEWNVPFVTISGNSPQLRNKKKYPTVISTSVTDNTVFHSFLEKILAEFQWTTVFLLCDTNDHVTPFYGTICSGVRTFFRRYERCYVVHEASFDSGSPDGFPPYILDAVATRARVVFIFADYILTRLIMIEAHRRKMTEGDYVYFFTQPYVFEPFFSVLTWRRNDSDDNIAREALRSVLYIVADTDPLVNNLPSDTLNKTLQQIKAFGNCRDHSKVPVEALLAYETVGLLAKFAASYTFAIEDDMHEPGVVDKLVNFVNFASLIMRNWVANDIATRNLPADAYSLLRGTNIIEELSNRTYQAALEEIAFDKDGIRLPNYVLQQFNYTTGSFENVLFYHGKQQSMSLLYQRDFSWRGAKPPDNEPRCGFDGSRQICRKRDLTPTEITLIVAAVVAFTCAISLYRFVAKSLQGARIADMMIPHTALFVRHLHSSFVPQ